MTVVKRWAHVLMDKCSNKCKSSKTNLSGNAYFLVLIDAMKYKYLSDSSWHLWL